MSSECFSVDSLISNDLVIPPAVQTRRRTSNQKSSLGHPYIRVITALSSDVVGVALEQYL